MTGDLVLLTGATGFTGYAVLVNLLKQGYRVRATVRSPAKEENLRSTSILRSLAPSSSSLSFVVVHDMSVAGAYDEAVKGVDYIIHVASPVYSFVESTITLDKLEEAFVSTTVRGTIGLLQAANNEASRSVKRVVLTSSVAAIIPIDNNDASRIWKPDDRSPVPPAPYNSEAAAYCAAKIAQLNEADAWMKTNDPGFDLVAVYPGFIFGRDELIHDATALRNTGSNTILLGLLTGKNVNFSLNNGVALVEDVARAHVLALRPNIQGNQGFVVQIPVQWEDAVEIAQEAFPDAFSDGRLQGGKLPTLERKWDDNTTRTVLGLELNSYETIVQAVSAQYLELLAKEET